MTSMLPHLLRAMVSTTMNVVLMLLLLQPKYSKRTTHLAMLGVLVLDFILALYCYSIGNLTLLAKLDILVFTVLCFVIKPLFRDNFMQWLFSYVTVQNVSAIIVVLSFIVSRYLPMPLYANTLIRLVLFLVVIFLLHFVVKPLYRQIVEHWTIFFYVALVIFINFAYVLLFSDDIVTTMSEQKTGLLLLIGLSVVAYISVFHSMKNLSREYTVREENLMLTNNEQLLRQSAQAMAQRLTLIDEAARQMSIINHDCRHFNNTLLELLTHGKTIEAVELLNKKQEYTSTPHKFYCENPTVNAAISYYASLAEKLKIDCDIHAQIQTGIEFDSLELSIVLSNLIENAINASANLPVGKNKYIRVSVLCDSQLIIEIENPYIGEITLDENAYPTTKENGHGIGTKSVLAFVRYYEGDVIYHISDNVFNVRLMI